MKNKNPLYVVKGKEVQEAFGLLDLVVKKFNLEPVIRVLESIFKMLLDQVKTWETFIAVKKFIDEMMETVLTVSKRFGKA
jgi:hypothetical protein